MSNKKEVTCLTGQTIIGDQFEMGKISSSNATLTDILHTLCAQHCINACYAQGQSEHVTKLKRLIFHQFLQGRKSAANTDQN